MPIIKQKLNDNMKLVKTISDEDQTLKNKKNNYPWNEEPERQSGSVSVKSKVREISDFKEEPKILDEDTLKFTRVRSSPF